MKSWYSKVRDTELIDGSIKATYVVTFETDSIELKREVEKYLQGIMDRNEFKMPTMDKCHKCKYWNYSYGCQNKKGICDFEPIADTPQTDCETCKYGQDKHRYAHICNECGVGINNYTPQTDIHGLTDCDFCKGKNCEDCEGGKDEPQTDYGANLE